MSEQFTYMFNETCITDDEWQTYDRGSFGTENGVLTVTDGWAAASKVNSENLSFAFSARSPEDSLQVQIWAGFRHYSRDYRYAAALRGGNNNHIYLARLGAEGYDKMLALRPLPFSPIPGIWYQLRIVCAGNKIAVYLGEDADPVICVEDDDAPFHTGSISLGGSYLPTQFKNVNVTEVDKNYLEGVKAMPDYLETVSLTGEDREKARLRDRGTYRPFVIPAVSDERLEVSLDGKWLFIPDYEIADKPLALDYDDSAFHVMTVPASWVPLQAWLEGETMHALNKGMNDSYHVEEFTRCLNQTFDYSRTKSAWYRHYLDLPRGITDKRVVLDFEGIALISVIYFNGVRVCENIGMFTPMQIDVSNYVREGRNVISVEVHRRLTDESEQAVNTAAIDKNYAAAWDILDGNEKGEEIDLKGEETALKGEETALKCERREFCTDDIPHGFYGGNPGGIWRSVHLIISDKVHIDDFFFNPTLEDAAIQVTYSNSGLSAKNVVLSYHMVHQTTGEFLCEGAADKYILAGGERRTLSFSTPKVTPLLWGPGTPNLYTLAFTISQNGVCLDTYSEQVGFRTAAFNEATLMYNNNPLWVRGGNHMPAHIKPTDRLLARKFMSLALKHNVIATRTHVAPWSSTWLDAADEAGIMVSFEGTWTWLMLEHIPSKRSIRIWKEELVRLIKRHRNRPSLFLMTMNNEMKFYLHDAPDEVVIEKGRILEGGIKAVREAAPHLPLVADSAYYRNHAVQSGRYERIIKANGFDDGDMDDPHGYFGWYNPDFFHFFNGQFGSEYTTPGRPCMSQECSVGYPRAEDGLPTRAYLFLHQTPQTTVGKKAYENCDPAIFLSRHAMLTKELLEMFRRVEHDRTCGVMLFAFETWFYNQHDSQRILPMLSAQKLKMAYQPVLASAELWGRHFYAGTVLETNITLINDAKQKTMLASPQVEVHLAAGSETTEVLSFESLPYFKTATKKLSLKLPSRLPADRFETRLVLRVLMNDTIISQNEYDILLANEEWGKGLPPCEESCYFLKNDAASRALLAHYGMKAVECSDLTALSGCPGRLIVSSAVSGNDGQLMRKFAHSGGKVILLGQQALPEELLGQTEAPFTAHRQEIITMNVPENSIFDGIDFLDTAWFSDGRDVPYTAMGRYSVDRLSRDIKVLAETLEWHGYIDKPTDYKKLGGTPLFTMKVGTGHILISSLRIDACGFDPVASRLTGNIINWDFDQI